MEDLQSVVLVGERKGLGEGLLYTYSWEVEVVAVTS